jgi:hypothetical protein
MRKENYYYDRKFDTIFVDSIFFTTAAYEALKNDKYPEEAHFARAAILNLSILPEVTANCILQTLNLPKKLNDEIDKFSPLSKFDFYLWEKKKEKLNRGDREVQIIHELQSIRNSLVHPKTKKGEWVDIDDTTRQEDLGATEILRIPYSSDEWQGDDPVIVLRGVLFFLNHFFRVLCSYKPGKVQHILFNSGEYYEEQEHGYVVYSDWKTIQK